MLGHVPKCDSLSFEFPCLSINNNSNSNNNNNYNVKKMGGIIFRLSDRPQKMLFQPFSDDGDTFIRDIREHLLLLCPRGLCFRPFPFCKSDIITFFKEPQINTTLLIFSLLTISLYQKLGENVEDDFVFSLQTIRGPEKRGKTLRNEGIILYYDSPSDAISKPKMTFK